MRRGRKRTLRPMTRSSNGMSTTRPSTDTPSTSRTAAIAYGASPAWPRGGIRITVNEAISPSPDSRTGDHCRSPHAGHSSRGGMASAPQPPHLMPVSVPSRARSKKVCSVIGGSLTAEQAHEHRRRVAAERMRQSGPRALDLARSGVGAKLGDDLADLRGAGGADRVALGLQPARGIHGDLAAEARPALLGGEPAGARLEEA